jgi:hypothetical protein
MGGNGNQRLNVGSEGMNRQGRNALERETVVDEPARALRGSGLFCEHRGRETGN